MDKKSRRDMDGNVSVTQPRKRNNMGEEKGRPSKKRKYVLVGPEWGTKAKKNQGLDCKVDESRTPLIEGNTAAVLKSGTAHSRIEGLFVFHKGPIQKFFKVKVFIP